MTVNEQFTVHAQPIDGNVIVSFSESITYLKMTPEQARRLAELINGCANAIEGKQEKNKLS